MNQLVVCDPFYVFKYDKREKTQENPNYQDFIILELSRLYLYELYYDFLQPYYVKDNLI